MMHDVRRQEGEPFDRLTSIAGQMLDVGREHADVKSIVMLSDGDHNGGIGLSGWDDDSEAIALVFIHLQAIFRSAGKELRVMTEDGMFVDGVEEV